MGKQLTQSTKVRMQKSPITFKAIHPDTGKRYSQNRYSHNNKDNLPLKIFYEKLAIGLILCKPSIQIQLKGKKMDIKPKTLGEAKAYVINNFHLYV